MKTTPLGQSPPLTCSPSLGDEPRPHTSFVEGKYPDGCQCEKCEEWDMRHHQAPCSHRHEDGYPAVSDRGFLYPNYTCQKCGEVFGEDYPASLENDPVMARPDGGSNT